MQLKPKKWGDFQHYRDRCPPWIKLHRDLLNNRDFMRLPIASKALAPLLWLLASESKDGVFDASIDELVFRLRLTEKEIKDGLKALLEGGFFENASNTLADSKQPAIPETETETETEGETKKKPASTVVERPSSVEQQVWNDWLAIRKVKRLPLTETAWAQMQDEIEASGFPVEVVIKECCLRGWAAFKVNWLKDNPITAPSAARFAGDL